MDISQGFYHTLLQSSSGRTQLRQSWGPWLRACPKSWPFSRPSSKPQSCKKQVVGGRKRRGNERRANASRGLVPCLLTFRRGRYIRLETSSWIKLVLVVCKLRGIGNERWPLWRKNYLIFPQDRTEKMSACLTSDRAIEISSVICCLKREGKNEKWAEGFGFWGGGGYKGVNTKPQDFFLP